VTGTSAYPASLDTFSKSSPATLNAADSKGRTHAERHDDLEAAVANTQTELGTTPSGSAATVRERFEAIEANDWVTSARVLAGAISPGKISGGYAAKTATYTLALTDRDVVCTSGTFTITLYAASGNAGRVHRILNAGSGTVTLDGDASETIDGNATVAIGRRGSLTIMCDGTNWIVLAGDTGLRDITSSLTAITNASLTLATLRRVNQQVQLSVRFTTSTTSGGGSLYTTGAGFARFTTSNFDEAYVGARPGTGGNNGLSVLSAVAGASLWRLDWSGLGGGSCAVKAIFDTPDAWPGSLPGSGL
jgi:hypothetical protein